MHTPTPTYTHLHVSQVTKVLSVININPEAIVSPDVRPVQQWISVRLTLQGNVVTLGRYHFLRRTAVKLWLACE